MTTFVKEGIQFTTVEAGNESEVEEVGVWVEDQNLRIIHYYNPCERWSRDILEEIRGENFYRLIWCGDFNGHSSLWGSKKNNGNIIEDMLDECELVCVNDERATRIDIAKGKSSALDLDLCFRKSGKEMSVWCIGPKLNR